MLLIKKSGNNIEFYCPKIEYYKHFRKKVQRPEKLALENYIFCYYKDFNDQMLKNYLDSEENLNTTAGVKMESKLFRKLIYKVQTEDEEAIIGLPIQWLLNTLDS